MNEGNQKKPRLKEIDRKQLFFRAVDIEKFIDEEHPARAIWDFVGQLDLSGFQEGIRAFEGQAGRSAFDPQLLISLWITPTAEESAKLERFAGCVIMILLFSGLPVWSR